MKVEKWEGKGSHQVVAVVFFFPTWSSKKLQSGLTSSNANVAFYHSTEGKRKTCFAEIRLSKKKKRESRARKQRQTVRVLRSTLYKVHACRLSSNNPHNAITPRLRRAWASPVAAKKKKKRPQFFTKPRRCLFKSVVVVGFFFHWDRQMRLKSNSSFLFDWFRT